MNSSRWDSDFARRDSNLLVERDEQISTLVSMVDAASVGSGSALLVVAAAGLGKSRLIVEGAKAASERAVLVLRARAVRSERDLPLSVALRLVEAHLAAVTSEQRASLLAGAAGLARPVLDGESGDAHEAAARSPFAVLHGLYWLLVNISAERPLLLCVDDLQWCDDTTLRLLLYLAERIEDLPIALLMAARPRRRGLDPEPLRALRGSQVVSTMELEPLGVRGVGELLQARLGSVDGEVRDACAEVTGGSPFYLQELLLCFDEQKDGDIATRPDRIRELGGDSLARAALFRLVRCDRASIHLAQALAVLGDRTPLRLAGSLAGLTLDEAGVAADELAGEQLIISGGSLEFAHPLIRQSIYEEIPPARRALQHAAAAGLLRSTGAPVELVAVQLMPSPPAAEGWVVQTLREAARQASDRGSPDTAARLLHRALAEGAAEVPASTLLLEIGAAETSAGLSGAPGHITQALDQLRGPRERIEAHRLLARALGGEGRPEEAVEVLEHALDELTSETQDLQTMLLADYLVDAAFLPGLRQRSIARAAALTRDLPEADTSDGRLLAAALAMRSGQAARPRSETVELAERAWCGGLLLDDSGPDGVGWLMAVWALQLAEDHVRSEEVTAAALDAARRIGALYPFITASYFRGDAYARLGLLDEAQADAEQAVRACQGGAHRYLSASLVLRANVLIERGKLEEAAVSLASADDLSAVGMLEVPWRLEARGRLALAEQRPVEALRLFEQAGAFMDERLQAEHSVLPWRSNGALAALQAGRPDRARELAEADLANADRIGLDISRGRALRVLGLISGGAPGLDQLTEAVDVLARSSAALERARAVADLGAALRRAGHLVDARPKLLDALASAERLDAERLASAVRQELGAAGVRAPRQPRDRAVLTPSQRRVAELAARGLSNTEIAQALFVTPKTVEYHLSQVYQRLQVPGRRHLAAALASAG
ncbi:MAG TPA: AAA family ATPase [Jatrophihabitans sp.]|jgi:DNA-binding CsgD family transcriptional regulator